MKFSSTILLFFALISLTAMGQEQIYDEPDVQPEFPGGQSKMMAFLQKNITYPAMARENGIQGTVYVQFVVEKDGKLTNVEVRKGIGSGCDKEAVRVVKKMPTWSPAQKGGKLVRCRYNVPIKFKLV